MKFSGNRNLWDRALCCGIAVVALAAAVEARTVLPERLNRPIVRGPDVLNEEQLSAEKPYKYGGLIIAHFSDDTFQRASGSVIGRNLVLTAAHVLYKESLREWATHVEFFPRYHLEPDESRMPHPIHEYAVWEAYAEFPDHGGFEVRQLDVAVLYDAHLGNSLYPPMELAYEGEPNRLLSGRAKVVSGYPSAIQAPHEGNPWVELENDFAMHRFGPELFSFTPVWDAPDEVLGSPFWNMETLEIPGISRNSGGPLHLLRDGGEWSVAGILITGNPLFSTYRIIAEDLLELLESLVASSDATFLFPPGQVRALAEPSGSLIEWTPVGAPPDGYEVWTQSLPGEDSVSYTQWRLLGRTPGESTQYTDTRHAPGQRQFFRVRAYEADAEGQPMNFGPFSRIVAVDPAGQNEAIAAALGELTLPWKTGGTTSAQVVASDEGNGQTVLFAGVDHLGKSWVETELTGPGTLEFLLETSSERNYDCLRLFINGSPFGRWSGETPPTEMSIQIAEGLHTIRWQYDKDKDVTRFRDRAWLHTVRWRPD